MIRAKFLLILTFISLPQAKPREKVEVKTSVFTSIYSEVLQQPLKVSYTVNCATKEFSRKDFEFQLVPGIITSDNDDYKNNDYDKGHMAPSADFSCSEALMKQTYSYANCALQHKDLNQGVWRLLEEEERKLSRQYQMVLVIVDVEFKKPLKVLPTGAAIPTGFTKTIYIPKTKQTFKYYMPNVKPKSEKFQDYLKK